MTMEKENRLIQVIRDPHVVFQEGGYSPRTLYSGYRAVILDEDDGINIISLADGDLDGDVTLKEVFKLCRYEDVEFATKKIIKDSIDAWYKDSHERKVNVTPKENAEWVLDQFRKAKMIDETLYKEILNEYE